MPEGRGFAGLDKAELGLMPARVEVFSGLVFVNLDIDAAPLAGGLGGLAERLAPYGIEGLERFTEATRASRRTGRSSPTTTSRATTSRSPTRA